MQIHVHYIDPQGGLHALTPEQVEEGFEARLPAGSRQISDEEADQVRADQKAKTDPQIEINAEARYYLASTDWYVIRQQETGQEVPADVLEQRQKARDSIK